MARKKNSSRKWGKLVLVGGLALGGYYAWKAGLFDRLWSAIEGAGNGTQNGGTNGNGSENGGTNGGNGGTNGTLTGLLAELWSLIQGAGGNGGNGSANGNADGQAKAGSQLPSGLQTALIAGVPAGGATIAASALPAAIAKVLVPLFLGLSPAAPELVHDVNVAIQGPSYWEKEEVILFTDRGPFILKPSTGICYDLSGHKITCPPAEDIVGVGQETIDRYAHREGA